MEESERKHDHDDHDATTTTTTTVYKIAVILSTGRHTSVFLLRRVGLGE